MYIRVSRQKLKLIPHLAGCVSNLLNYLIVEFVRSTDEIINYDLAVEATRSGDDTAK